MKNTATENPVLAPPGAGLPKPERFIANRMIRLKAALSSRERAAEMFAREQAAIHGLLGGCDAAALSRRVLIKRIRGLEDSSRYWSMLMVVDHLRIVNRDIGEVIECLGQGRRLEKQASIAGVKPGTEVTGRVIAAFDEECRKFTGIVAGVKDLRTALKYDHPWFGPMDAATWHFLTGFHMRLHRRQMELIMAGMA